MLNDPVHMQVQYKLKEDKKLDFHFDDSEVTLNVCLGKDFEGMSAGPGAVKVRMMSDTHRLFAPQAALCTSEVCSTIRQHTTRTGSTRTSPARLSCIKASTGTAPNPSSAAIGTDTTSSASSVCVCANVSTVEAHNLNTSVHHTCTGTI
jgi:hypothetical protein